MIRCILLISFLISFNFLLHAQNLIVNPDLSDYEVTYKFRKIAMPVGWKSLNRNMEKLYIHQERIIVGDFRNFKNKSAESNGYFSLHFAFDVCDGVYSKLPQEPEEGKEYVISIDLKIIRLSLNSDLKFPSYNFKTKEELDSIDKDYNYPTDLITGFYDISPQNINANRRFTIIEIPQEYKYSYDQNFTLRKTITTKGDEKYFFIGAKHSNDYFDILKIENNDTTNYHHKFARYQINGVSITPVFKAFNNDSIKFIENLYSDSLAISANQFKKFVFKNLQFEFGSTHLNNKATSEIENISEYLKARANIAVKIIGHTDSIGCADFNQKLSEQRAQAVYQHLISFGINKSRLHFSGLGENQPLNESQLIENQGINRRVEFEFTSGDTNSNPH